MKHFNILYLITLCTCVERKSPMITIPNQGTIMGKEISMIRTQRILAYLGIPYAQPPVGQLRFSPPVTERLPSWEKVRNATEYAPGCLQTNENYDKQELPFLRLISNLTYVVDEDCLYLNVFVPFGGYVPPEGFATIVWIHPGNFTSGNPEMWNPYTLVYRHRVIVVTFAYRLNIMGFFTSNDGEAIGNYGLMDQQAALQWIKNNVKLFGGNPENICLMGYGTGSVSIGLHMILHQSRGLFAKAIMMSGNFLNPAAVKYPQEDKGLMKKLSEEYGCFANPTPALLACLRRIHGLDLVKLTAYVDWRPLIDQGISNSTPFLSEPPKSVFERDEYYKVPILTGYTNMEEVLAIDSLDPEIVPNESISPEFIRSAFYEILSKDFQTNNSSDSCSNNYDYVVDSTMFFYEPTTKMVDPNEIRKFLADFSTDRNFGSSTYLHAKYANKDQSIYLYRCDMKPSTLGATADIPEWVSVPHLFDLIYVWGIPYWTLLPNQEWDIRDKRTSDIIMSFWTNFARTSNPTENSVYPITWDAFTKEHPSILIIDRNFSMSDNTKFNYKSLEFWNEYYPKVINIAGQCCNATDWGSAPQTFDSFSSSIYFIFSVLILRVFQ